MRAFMTSLCLAAGLMLTVAQSPAQAQAPVTATCKDGSAFSGASRSGACRGHGGVQTWGEAAAPAAAATPAAKPVHRIAATPFAEKAVADSGTLAATPAVVTSASPAATPPFTRSSPSLMVMAGTPALAREKWSAR